MLSALYTPTLVSPSCPIPLGLGRPSTALCAFCPWGRFNNSFPILIPVPVPIPVSIPIRVPVPVPIAVGLPVPFPVLHPIIRCLLHPLPIFSLFPFCLPIFCSLPFPRCFLSTLCILLTLAVIIVITIARTAPPTALCSGFSAVLIIIILVDYLIPIQGYNSQKVVWFVLLAGWWLHLCPEIIATVPRETHTTSLSIPRAGFLQIGVIDLFPEGTGVAPPPIVYLAVDFVKHLPHVWEEARSPLPNRQTPASAVWPYLLELWKVASHDYIKKDFIIEEVCCPCIFTAADIEYPYESTDVFQDESLYVVPIQWQGSIFIPCWHLCHSLPHCFAAALWWHHCEWKMNLHLKY